MNKVNANINGLKFEAVECSRSINSKKDKRGKIQELIIVGKNFGK